jgi:putative DNA primase/helicase
MAESQLQFILDHLQGVARHGGATMALCPAHEDRVPSLSVTTGAEGRVLLKCHAGCETERIVEAMNLTLADLFERSDDIPQRSVGPCTLLATYHYVDEGGSPLYEVRRYSDKSFMQHKTDGSAGIQNIRRVLYHLDLIQGKKTVYVGEGEKDVDRLWAVNFPATCCSGGSNGWRPEHVEQLVSAGVKQVVVLPDNDEPGMKYAKTVADGCLKAGLVVKLVELPAAKPGGDVTDFLDGGGTPGALGALVRIMSPYTPEDGIRFSFNKASSRKPMEVTWLWPGRIPISMLTLFAGNAGEGKSFLSLEVAARLSRGTAWPDGSSGSQPADSIIIASEDVQEITIIPRLTALGADLNRITIVPPPETPKQEPFSLVKHVDDMRALVRKTQAKLIVIDPINTYLGGKVDNYRDPEVRQALIPFVQIGTEFGLALIGIMHLSKTMQTEVLYRIGGSVAFAALARAVFFVSHDKEDEDRRLFMNAKMSVAKKADTRAFRILPSLTLEWEKDSVDITAGEALREEPEEQRKDKRNKAADWLTGYLTGGTKSQKDVAQAAKAEGFSSSTVSRAKTQLGVKASPDTDDQGHIKGWLWELPDGGMF